MIDAMLRWQEQEQVQTFSIAESQVIHIGRDAGCDIVLAHKSVSRRHASISGEAAGFLLHNLSRTNPIYINEQHKLLPNQQIELVLGDIFRIEQSWFTIQSTLDAVHVVECTGCNNQVDGSWQICKYCGMSLAGASTIVDWENLA